MVIFGVTLQEELSEAVEVLYHTSGHGRYSKKKEQPKKATMITTFLSGPTVSQQHLGFSYILIHTNLSYVIP